MSIDVPTPLNKRLVLNARQLSLRRSTAATSSQSLTRLKALGIPVEEQLQRINTCLRDIDQLLIPSTINNFINQRFVLGKEREVVSIFAECDARALNYLINHVKLGLLFYKIKDHRNFASQHRTELIQLLAVDRLHALTVMSRVIVLHALQLMKLRANPRAEYWVRNIIQSTHQGDLSELKTLTDAKGDYFSMKKLLYDDIKSQTIRHDILNHIRREAAVQQAHIQMGTKKARSQLQNSSWRKILSDVDDTLSCSGGSYPAGVDRRFGKKVVYPGVLAFYRELDLGIKGPEEWPDSRVGNLVFLSARPHVYKDVSEKINFAKFEKLRVDVDGRKRMHTVPSLLAGDIASGTEYMMTNDMEPLALKKYDNFQRYVSIYPEYEHIFVCDNGQGDVRAGEMMFDAHPYEFGALYVHVVQGIPKTHGYAPERWRQKGFKPCFFRTYPEAALHAATREPPLIRTSGLRRICEDAVKDFELIKAKQWPSRQHKVERRAELNQSIWRANEHLVHKGLEPVPCIIAEQIWGDRQKVRTPYGIGTVVGFDPMLDLYEVELDWRPLPVQVEEYLREEKQLNTKTRFRGSMSSQAGLETVVESVETDDDSETGQPFKKLKDEESTDTASQASSSLGKEAPFDQVHPCNETTDHVASDHSEPQQLESGVEAQSNEESRKSQNRILARIHCRDISKYTPPTLPKLEKDRANLFSFWGPEKKKQIRVGDRCSSPYGLCVVEELRPKKGMYVVKMVGWQATAYLNETEVKPISKGLLQSFLQQFSSKESSTKASEFPYAEGTIIKTPFGEARVTRPLPMPKGKRSKESVSAATIGLSLTDWVQANQGHPTLYCTVETARKWKDTNWRKSAGGGLFSVFGSLVSKTLMATNLVARNERKLLTTHLHERYYRDGAAVDCRYGNGRVRKFREVDGFYEVALVQWKLVGGRNATAFLRESELRPRIAPGCNEGYPVLTRFGLTGVLASVEPTSGVHIVTIPSAGMVSYLQPEEVVMPIKAAVGEDVLTAYGEGKVSSFRKTDNIYVVTLKGWGAALYAQAETIDRVIDGLHDLDGSFGMKWLLSFFSFMPDNGYRSRSNSIARSHSGRSVV